MRVRDQKLNRLTEYPFPLADGDMGFLYLPPKLHRPDAERLKRMIDSLVMDADTQEAQE